MEKNIKNTNREALFKGNRFIDHEKYTETYMHNHERHC